MFSVWLPGSFHPVFEIRKNIAAYGFNRKISYVTVVDVPTGYIMARS
jgi:hypothetical protein